jgi:hypothetical protein
MRTAGKTPLPVGAATCGTKRKRRKTGDSPSPDYTAVASSLYGMRQRSFLKESTSASIVGVYVAPQAKEKEVPHTSLECYRRCSGCYPSTTNSEEVSCPKL